ncbi:MAG: hypothetical protein M3069_18405 [Chloroflexota bacterium]|nr:hypothetical protein [Chloroflexota bacterium]
MDGIGRRFFNLHPRSWFTIVAVALSVGSAMGNSLSSQVVAAQAQVDPAATSATVPDLPSLGAEPVAIAVALDAALNGGDVEAVLNMFDDAAVVKIPPDVYTGSPQIRNWASYLVANHFGTEPGLRHLGRESIIWPAEVRSDQLARFGIASLHGEATLTVRNGKIASYTFVLTRESAAQLRAAQIAAADVLQDPLVVGADLANVYGSNDVFRGADGALVSYRDLVGAEPGSGPFFDLGGQPVVLRTGL